MGKYDLLFSASKWMQNMYGNYLCIRRIPYVIKSRKIMKRNKELITERTKTKCYILGLGPSLTNVEASTLNDGDVFVVNNFYSYDDAEKFNPKLYLMMDNHYYDDNFQANDRNTAFDKFPRARFILNGKFYNSELDKKEGVYWIYAWKGYGALRKTLDMTRVMPAFDNVVCTAISVALYMGYSEIVLLGCDFNSFATPKIQHCYCREGEERDMTLQYEMYIYSFVAEQHRLLAKYATNHQMEIVNSTKGSLLDTYPRKDEDRYIKGGNENGKISN